MEMTIYIALQKNGESILNDEKNQIVQGSFIGDLLDNVFL